MNHNSVPVIVYPHGGPHSLFMDSFDPDVTYLVKLGKFDILYYFSNALFLNGESRMMFILTLILFRICHIQNQLYWEHWYEKRYYRTVNRSYQ